ncbi:hypothetical protein FF38_06023 [Lucilia cuprina]|uniref:Uncharacterized protein n=1 Tax=Lucilia cuprina TaxID=7375 RepID=A0A0L0CCI6_LUCCU|nr:hypothetical protein FF38_06023 [Lucilia cuprina]
MNTNADDLSRIHIDSDILKQMIPLHFDEKANRCQIKYKTHQITKRKMKRKIKTSKSVIFGYAESYIPTIKPRLT